MPDELQPTRAHAVHDPVAVAAHAVADTSVEAVVGARLVAACAECAALAADLRGLATATAALKAVPMSAPRDFRLSEADARRLSRRGWLARLTGTSDGVGSGRLQGFGGAVAALGLAGFVVAFVGPSTAMDAANGAFGGTREGPAAGATQQVAPVVGPAASGESTEMNDGTAKNHDLDGAAADDIAARQTLAIVSGSAVVAGLGLVLAGRTRRRRA